MYRSRSSRWLKTSLVTLAAAVAMFADAITIRAAHEPKTDFVIFIVLMVVCGATAFVLGSVGIAKSRTRTSPEAASRRND
jgi:hypothetical protein